MVSEHAAAHAPQWAAIESIAAKVGCTAETLRRWLRQGEQFKALERENRELRQADEILRKASACFA
jgi:transposase-like protein